MKIKSNDILYYFAIFLMAFISITINASYLAEYILEIGKFLQYICLLLFIISMFQTKWSIKNLMLSIIMFLLFCYVAIHINQSMVIVNIMAIIASNNKNFKQTVKVIMCSDIICVFIVLLLCFCGFLPNMSFNHNGQIVYSYGFYYYTNLAFYVFYISLMMVLIEKDRKKANIKIIVLLFINIMLYQITSTRLTFLLFIIFFFTYFFIMGTKYFDNNSFWRMCGTFCYPLCALFVINLSVYHTDKIFWRNFVNVLLMNRPLMGQRALEEYGLHLLGVEMKFNTGGVNDYFYVDSGYMYVLLMYGIIIFFVLMIMYSLLTRYFVINKEKELFIWSVIMAIFSIINNAMFGIVYNPLILLMPELVKGVHKKFVLKKKN